MPNQLTQENSLYLQQHADNPVDWYPWGDAAFKEAESSGKPLIVSIGYSSCHWCHVMEHESFEDQQVAKIMNDNFICICIAHIQKKESYFLTFTPNIFLNKHLFEFRKSNV